MTRTSSVAVVGPAAYDRLDGSGPAIRERLAEVGDTLLVRTRLPGGTGTDWHSHGERDGYGYVLAGRARVEYGPDGRDAVEVGEGEFFRLSRGLVHRTLARAGGFVALVALVGTGAPVVAAAEPAAPGEGPDVAGAADLVPAGVLANVTRLTPFPDAPVQQIRGHAAGNVASSWHHHGDNDVFGYVLRGVGYVELGSGPGERELARAGECFYVPAGVVHRDVNPSDEEQDYVLWLTGSEPRVVPVAGPGG